MSFRLRAFGLHLCASLTALTLTLGALYLGWYRWPGWYLAGAPYIVMLVALVDLALGPTLTLVVASPGKARRALARDIGAIVLVQLAALGYGSATLWSGRPLYYAFSLDRLQLVQASDFDAHEIALGRQHNPALTPHWYSLPRWIWAPLPDDPREAARIAENTVFGGQDVIQMPRYFRPWEQGLTQLREHLTALEDVKELSRAEKNALRARLQRLAAPPAQRNLLLLWGEVRRVVVVFDPDTLRIKAMLQP
jgi:hypothetical protein